MGGGNRHPPEAGIQDEVGMRSRARGRLTEVPWRLAFSFAFSALSSPQDMLQREKHRPSYYWLHFYFI